MQLTDRRQWLKSAGLLSGGLPFLLTGQSWPSTGIFPWESSDNIGYQTGDLIKLSSNENPYGPSDSVKKAMSDAFGKVCRYPGRDIDALTEKIAFREGVSADHILITIGSTEGLKLAVLAYLRNGGELVAAQPTFEAMLTYAEACGAYVHRVPVDKHMVTDLQAMSRRCNADTKLVFVCNPNNPTGTILPEDEMTHFCTEMAKRTMVFCDEVYIDYINRKNYPSMISLVKNDMNVIVSRTFSKVYGLAGLRIGYLIARPEIISRIKKLQIDRPNILALVAAEAAMKDDDFYSFSLNKNNVSKKMICETLDHLGIKYTDSHANFVFFKSGIHINTLSKKMEEKSVQIGRAFAPFTDWCRLSTGRTEDMPVVQEALKSIFT
jgi:histidinol-phosphate aminotransferase